MSLAILCLAWVGMSGSVGANSDVHVTSVSGGSEAGGVALSQHSTVASGETIRVDKNGRASIFVANTVVNLCNGATMTFPTQSSHGAQILGISEGEIKASAGPRENGTRLEIHTPVAIATLLGTAVHVAVDPETGDSIITSLEHRVRVENIDKSVTGYVILSAGDQVVVRRNEAPTEVSKVDRGAFNRSSSCLDDSEFRRTALLIDHKSLRLAALASITAMDIPASPDMVPSVSSSSQIMDAVTASSVGGFDPIDGPGCGGRCDDKPNGSATFDVPDVLPQLPQPP